VAIPAVLAFNYLSTKISQEELVLTHSAGELLDTIDDWEERRSQVEPHNGSRRLDGEMRLDGEAVVGAHS
jgi:hypothetical protein